MNELFEEGNMTERKRRWLIPFKKHWVRKEVLPEQFTGVPIHDLKGNVLALVRPVFEKEEEAVYEFRIRRSIKEARMICDHFNSLIPLHKDP